MTAIHPAPTADTVHTDPTLGLRRRVTAIALPLGFALQILANTTYAIATADGGGDDTGARALQLYAAHPGALLLASGAALLGVLCALPGLSAAVRVLRPFRPRLALSATTLMAVGYVCYFGIVMLGYRDLALALAGVDAAAAIDATAALPGPTFAFALFVLGNLVGTTLLGVAVMLSRSLPWWAGMLIIGWPVGHVLNLAVGSEWFAVAGGVLEVIGLCAITVRALRTDDAIWATRG